MYNSAPILDLNRIVALPKELNKDQFLLKASESVRDRLLQPDEFLLIDEGCEPFIPIGLECNSPEDKDVLPVISKVSSEPTYEDDPGHHSALGDAFEFIRIVKKLIIKMKFENLVQFVDFTWKLIEMCHCGIETDRLTFVKLVAKLRGGLLKRIEFDEELFRELKCHQMLVNRRKPFGIGGHSLWRNGQTEDYGGYEPSLWPMWNPKNGAKSERYPGRTKFNWDDYGPRNTLGSRQEGKYNHKIPNTLSTQEGSSKGSISVSREQVGTRQEGKYNDPNTMNAQEGLGSPPNELRHKEEGKFNYPNISTQEEQSDGSSNRKQPGAINQSKIGNSKEGTGTKPPSIANPNKRPGHTNDPKTVISGEVLAPHLPDILTPTLVIANRQPGISKKIVTHQEEQKPGGIHLPTKKLPKEGVLTPLTTTPDPLVLAAYNSTVKPTNPPNLLYDLLNRQFSTEETSLESTTLITTTATTTSTMKSPTINAPELQDISSLLKSREPVSHLSKIEKGHQQKVFKPYLWHVGRDLIDYDGSPEREPDYFERKQNEDGHEFLVKWKDNYPDEDE